MKIFTCYFLLVSLLFFSNKIYARERNTPVTESIRSNLYLLNADNSTVLADGNLVQFSNSYCSCVDRVDAVKLGNIDETFGLMRDNVLLAIERRPLITIADTLFFSLAKTTERNYQFQFITTLLNHPGIFGTLKDRYSGTNTSVNLNGITTINFSVDSNAASKKTNRFMIVFSSSSIVPVNFTSVSARQQGNVTNILWTVENELNIKQYQIDRSSDGSNFISIADVRPTGNNESMANKYSWADATTLAGNCLYRICSIGVNGELIYSKTVKVNNSGSTQTINIYPNPLITEEVNLQMNNVPTGVYKVYFLNTTGQIIQTNTIDHEANTNETIMLDDNFSRGFYQMELSPVGGRKIVVSFIKE
jgi:hypothetical protein